MSARLKVYKDSAQKHDLSNHEQIYLVNAIYSLSFTDQKTEALIDLIKNPSLTAEARSHLVDRLGDLSFNSDRQKVLEALTENPLTQEPGELMN